VRAEERLLTSERACEAGKDWSIHTRILIGDKAVKAKPTNINEDVASIPASRLTRKGMATRTRIVQKAAAAIYERGVAATTTEEILRAADVSNSQLYHYFSDRDDVAREVAAHQIQLVLAEQQRLLERVRSVTGLRRWRDHVVAAAAEPQNQHGCPIGALAVELADHDEAVRVALRDAFECWHTTIRETLESMLKSGRLREDADPDQLAHLTLSAVQGGLLLTQISHETRALESALDGAIDHIETFVIQPGQTAPAPRKRTIRDDVRANRTRR
jgi:AcrR family transcriptional regulator